jgi:hypothetical protein
VAGEIRFLHRVKVLTPNGAPLRLDAVEKSPPKAREMKFGRGPSKFAGLSCDPVADLRGAKLPHRVRRAAKLRFFRVFKLLNAAKAETNDGAPVRTLAAGAHDRWMRRL